MEKKNYLEDELDEALIGIQKDYHDYKIEILRFNKIVSLMSLVLLISVSFHLVLTIILWGLGY